MTKKATPSLKKSKKLTLSKKTLKDLGAKDTAGVRGGMFVKTVLCSYVATHCRLQCCAATGTCQAK